jgi:hypothetical protein
MALDQEFWQKNRGFIIAGIIVLAAIIIFAVRNQSTDDNQETKNEQTSSEEAQQGENMEKEGEENKNSDTAMTAENKTTTSASEASGNVTATGTLKASDNMTKGNLMVASDKGTIYIRTGRDYTSLQEKKVTLMAEGTLQSFTLLGLKEAGAETTPTKDTSNDTKGEVNISGKLEKSDNMSKGNYVVASASGKIYLQTARDYSAWVGSEVTLMAKGSLQSFTHATLSKK